MKKKIPSLFSSGPVGAESIVIATVEDFLSDKTYKTVTDEDFLAMPEEAADQIVGRPLMGRLRAREPNHPARRKP